MELVRKEMDLFGADLPAAVSRWFKLASHEQAKYDLRPILYDLSTRFGLWRGLSHQAGHRRRYSIFAAAESASAAGPLGRQVAFSTHDALKKGAGDR